MSLPNESHFPDPDQTGSRAAPARSAFRGGAAALVVASAGVLSVQGQEGQPFMSRTSPSMMFDSPQPAKYNLNWGRVKGRFRASVMTEFNDNVNLSHSDAKNDFSIGPEVGVGFFLPLSHRNLLHVDLGVGYRQYLQNSELSTFVITPDTHLDYRIWVKDVQVNFHDDFFIQADPATRPELSGGLFNFRRLLNTSGVDLAWQPAEDWTLRGGYSFVLDRSLNSEFTALDRNGHVFNAGTYYSATPRWTLGMLGTYSINDYLQRIQNGNYSWSAGPTAIYRHSEFLMLEAAVSMTEQIHRQVGTIQDNSDFSGITYFVGINHTLNSWANHSIKVRRSVELGLFSNYTESQTVQYSINAAVTSSLSLQGSFSYQQFEASGAGGEGGDIYIGYVGARYALSSRWSLGIGYAISIKDSDLPQRDYVQNRANAELRRQF